MNGVEGVHIGDGAYLAYDGDAWTVNTDRADGVHYVVLGRRELVNLVGIAVKDDPDLIAGIRAAFAWAAGS